MAQLQSSQYTVAFIGNPNTGKSTLFSALAGVRQRTGNYPGVTVEKKVGHLEHAGHRFELVDLPGTYSLAPRSPDEMVAVDVLLARRDDVRPIDLVVSIVDASNLERNLYLVSQVLELGLPTVVVLNMIDVAEHRGLAVQSRPAAATTRRADHRDAGQSGTRRARPEAGARRTGRLDAQAARQPLSRAPFRTKSPGSATGWPSEGGRPLPAYLVERLLLDSSGYLSESLLNGQAQSIGQELTDARARLAAAGCPVPAVEAMARYAWVAKTLRGRHHPAGPAGRHRGDRIDRILTHRVWGTAIFALLMLLVFSSIFVWAEPAMNLVDAGIHQPGPVRFAAR